MKIKIKCLTVLLGLALWSPLYLQAKVVDRIVAVVNDDVITQYDLDRAMAIRLTEFKGKKQAKTEEMEKEVLNSLIQQKLLQQEIERIKVQVEDAELARSVSRVLQENGMTIEVLRRELSNKGIRFEDFKEQLAQEIRQVKFIQQMVAPNVEVTDLDVANFKSDLKISDGDLYEVQLSWIFIPMEEKADAKDVKKLMMQGMKIAEKGRRGHFERLIAKYSKKYKKSYDGKGQTIPVGKLPSNVAMEVRRMEVGGVSDPILSPDGLYIVKLFEKTVKEGAVADKVAASAPIVDDNEIRQKLFNERMQQEIQNYLLGLRKKAFIEIRN